MILCVSAFRLSVWMICCLYNNNNPLRPSGGWFRLLPHECPYMYYITTQELMVLHFAGFSLAFESRNDFFATSFCQRETEIA